MSYTEQAETYRAYALEAGCICPEFPPGIHLEECRLYVDPSHSILLKAIDQARREQIPLSRVVTRMLALEIAEMGTAAYLEHLEEEHREDQP